MKRRYKVKDGGYLSVMRDIQVLLQDRTINFTTFGAYICFVFQADWDKRHENYRVILPNDKEMAKLWGCDESTVYRNRIKLIKMGLLELLNGNTYVKNLDLFNIATVKTLAKKEHSVVNLHTFYAKSEKELAKMMLLFERTQEDWVQKAH
ncbi:MAG: hypothetical protein ABIJ85_03550 [bacterium]